MTVAPPSPDEPAATAIPRLVDLHGAQLYGLGLRLCGGPEDARDLVQETFLNAFRKWEQFEGRAAPSTWLFTIATRACQRLQRRKAGEPRRLDSLEALLPAAEARVPDLILLESDGPEADRLRREARERVEAALVRLPAAFRLPLVLKDIAELSVGEVAQILGLKEATVKTRVHRARLFLRRELAETLPGAAAPPPDHARRVCLDLLRGKQESLDRGVPFPVPSSELCSRCRALFETLDLTREACEALRQGVLPADVRRLLDSEIAAVARSRR